MWWAAAAVLLLDQASKLWLAAALAPGQGLTVSSFLNLVHVRNPGAAFSLLSTTADRWLMLGLTVLGLAVLLGWAVHGRPRGRLARLGLGLALGGAAGNLIDRIRVGMVTDFLDLHVAGYHWPTFNLADSGLTVGFILVGLSLIRAYPNKI